MQHPSFSQLEKCSNYNVEIKNNLNFIDELMQNNYYLSIYRIVRYLIPNYTENVEKEIMKYLKINKEIENYQSIVNILEILNCSIRGWRVLEHIISKVDNELIISKIQNIVFNTGVVDGDYGIVNDHIKKAEFLDEISKKTKNRRVREFATKNSQILKTYAGYRKLETQKEFIKESIIKK